MYFYFENYPEVSELVILSKTKDNDNFKTEEETINAFAKSNTSYLIDCEFPVVCFLTNFKIFFKRKNKKNFVKSQINNLYLFLKFSIFFKILNK